MAFKALLRGNLIRSCPVQEKDVCLAYRMFGKDAAVLQGKSTRPTPLIPVNDMIEIPAELMENINKDLELAIDVMFVNKQIYLTSIDRTIVFKAVVPRPTREDPDLL